MKIFKNEENDLNVINIIYNYFQDLKATNNTNIEALHTEIQSFKCLIKNYFIFWP